MKPAWLERLDEARSTGRTRGYVLEGNTADKVFFPEGRLPPMLLRNFLAAHLAPEGYAVGLYSLANGFEELRPPGSPERRSPFFSLPDNLPPDQVLAHMTRWLRSPQQPVALILDYADHMAPCSGGPTSALVGQIQFASLEVMHSWGLDENIRATRNLVFLISYESQVSDLLLQSGVGYQRLEISLPREPERQQFLEALTGRLNGAAQGPQPVSSLSVGELARVTAGLPYGAMEDLLLSAAATGKPLSRELIRDRKAAVIRQLCQGLLEVHEPVAGFEGVSGLEYAKEELGRLMDELRHNPQSAPQALLLVGVPGCGKSWLVQALAKELGYPCLAMRNVREGLVGASERNLERVLAVAESLSPCVLWMDEIDQVMGQRNTGPSLDAGTSERMMGRVLEFMGSLKHRGRILWVGTSNRPDLLDSALLDRYQLVLPFLHPSPPEVRDYLPALAAQVGRTLASDVRGDVIAALPSLRHPTVRALQEVVARAGTLTDVDTGQPGSAIDHAHLKEAALDFKPNYNPLQHQLIALTALRMASFKALLPWRNRTGLRPGAVIPDYLQGLVDCETGELDTEALNRRMDELALSLQREQLQRRF